MAKLDLKIVVRFNRLGEYADQVVEEMHDICDDAAEEILSTAQQLVPVDTGYLHDSIHHAGAGNPSEVVVEAEYGPYVEYGTWKMAPQPYFWPAVEMERPVFIAAVRAALQGTGASISRRRSSGSTRRRAGGTRRRRR